MSVDEILTLDEAEEVTAEDTELQETEDGEGADCPPAPVPSPQSPPRLVQDGGDAEWGSSVHEAPRGSEGAAGQDGQGMPILPRHG